MWIVFLRLSAAANSFSRCSRCLQTAIFTNVFILQFPENSIMSLWKSGYYDKPEGEDYIGKMVFTNKVAFQAAVAAGKELLRICCKNLKFHLFKV